MSQIELDNQKSKREFVCGNSDCRKKYGTNSALYTHIKNKHQGVTPVIEGTQKPPSESIKGRKGRPMQCKSSSQSGNTAPSDRIKIAQIMSSQQFQDFIYLIGTLGEGALKREIIRDQDDDYGYISEQELEEIAKEAVSLQIGPDHQSKVRHVQYMVHSSPYWNQDAFYPIFYFSIFSFSGGTFNELKQRTHSVEDLRLLRQLIEQNPAKVQIAMSTLADL